jgi:hypothetical protein
MHVKTEPPSQAKQRSCVQEQRVHAILQLVVCTTQAVTTTTTSILAVLLVPLFRKRIKNNKIGQIEEHEDSVTAYFQKDVQEEEKPLS